MGDKNCGEVRGQALSSQIKVAVYIETQMEWAIGHAYLIFVPSPMILVSFLAFSDST
jgi:hypothetical protein